MKEINPNIYPKSGYVFKDSDGAVISGDSWAGVISRVIAYRKRQGKSFDKVSEEVISQACQKNSSLCVEDTGVRQAHLKVATLKGRVLKWLTAMQDLRKKNEVVFVSESLRDARADVCSRCPKDKGMSSDNCGSCRAALKELQRGVVGERKGDARFSACPVLGEFLPVAVWIEQQAVANDELWVECWRKRTL